MDFYWLFKRYSIAESFPEAFVTSKVSAVGQNAQPSKNGKAKMNFNDLRTIFSGVCTDILVDDTDDTVTDLHFVLGQLRETQENVSGLNDSDLSAIKVVNLLLPAVNVIASKTAICSVVKTEHVCYR